jgi:hypothetical protein
VLLKKNIKYLPITTTTDKWFKNTPKKANTLSESWVKKHFTITIDGMRYWVAQSILAKEPNNYRKVAAALMDMVAIIMAIYGNNYHSPNESELDYSLNLLSNLYEDISLYQFVMY